MKKVLCTFAAVMVSIVSVTTAEEIKGVLALGYANATYWKAKPCMQDKRSLELNQTCPLIAILPPMALEKKDTPGQALPVTLKCANTENGTFELMLKFTNGRALFAQVTYKDKKLAIYSLFDSDQGREGGTIFDFTKGLMKWGKDEPVRKMPPDELNNPFNNPFVNVMELLRQKVCIVLQ